MCELCHGTHVVYESGGYFHRTNCCPVCGPEPKEVINARLDKIIAWADEMIKKGDGNSGKN